RRGHHHQRRLRIVFRQSQPTSGGRLLVRGFCFSILLSLVCLERLLHFLLHGGPNLIIWLNRTFGVAAECYQVVFKRNALQWFTRKNEEQMFSPGNFIKSKPAQPLLSSQTRRNFERHVRLQIV